MLGRPVWFLLCFVILGLYSCQKETEAFKTPDTTDPPGATNTNVNQATLLQLVNNVRLAGCTCGSTVMPPVPTLTWNTELAKAALDHSNDMYSNDYFSHTGLDGSSAGDRITAAGYKWRAYGENIARGYSTEQAVMDGWLKSEDHCKNIMGSLFKEMGVGRTGNYWAQEFGSR